MSDQGIFTLKYSDLHYEQGKKINIRNPLTETQRRSSCLLSFMMTVHLYQEDPKRKHNSMYCRAYVKLPLYVYGIEAIIDNQIVKPPHDLLSQYGIKTDIGTINK